MFTGIIEEIGKAASIKNTGDAYKLSILAKKVVSDIKLGDSIAVNGVCLTAASLSSTGFTADVMPETLKATNIGKLKPGSSVNLERAIAAGGRFGGHFVSGHVDGTGKIIRKQQLGNAVQYEIGTSEELMEGLIVKGSVAVDGTSLTVFDVSQGSFTLSLIPHTLAGTILGEKECGDTVNIESDMVGKYVGHFIKGMKRSNKTTISEAFLQENGFM